MTKRRNPSYYSITAGTRHGTFGAAKSAEVRALRAEGGGSGGVDKATKRGGRFFYRTVTVRDNAPMRKKKNASKRSKVKRMSTALKAWLKRQNPAMKKARGVRVQRLKGGVIKLTPVK